MRQLSGLDSLFLDLETRSCPMHVGSVLLFDPHGAGADFGFASVLEHVRRHLHLVPAFRQRLVQAPLNLDLPYWIDDPDFDIEHHVLHRTLPAPGGLAELWRFVADVVSRPLHRDMPLWRFYFVDGLSRGRVAVITKMHHACVDGVSGVDVLSRLLDADGDAAALPPARAWRGEPPPSAARLGWSTARNLLRQPAHAVRLLRDTVPAVISSERARRTARRAAKHGRAAASRPPGVPRTRFNTMIGARRSYHGGTLSLSHLRKLRRATGASINDIVLCLCGEALRNYLRERDELPAQSLWAGVPISVRAADERGQFGNRVRMGRTALRTDIADPLERLRAISSAMGRVKHEEAAIPARLQLEWLDVPAPSALVQAARLAENFAVLDHLPPMFNVVISNIPGSPRPLHFAGARLLHSYPVSIPYHGLALNITVMSYRNRLDYGLTAHRESVPDIGQLGRFLEQALGALERRVEAAQS